MPMRERTLPTRHTLSPKTQSRLFQSPPLTPLPSPPLPPANPVVDALEGPARTLGAALVAATQCVEQTIVLAFHQAEPPARLFAWHPAGKAVDTEAAGDARGWTFCQRDAIHGAEKGLVAARDDAREQLGRVFKELQVEGAADLRARPLIPKDALSCCLAMIALLQARRLSPALI